MRLRTDYWNLCWHFYGLVVILLLGTIAMFKGCWENWFRNSKNQSTRVEFGEGWASKEWSLSKEGEQPRGSNLKWFLDHFWTVIESLKEEEQTKLRLWQLCHVNTRFCWVSTSLIVSSGLGESRVFIAHETPWRNHKNRTEYLSLRSIVDCHSKAGFILGQEQIWRLYCLMSECWLSNCFETSLLGLRRLQKYIWSTKLMDKLLFQSHRLFEEQTLMAMHSRFPLRCLLLVWVINSRLDLAVWTLEKIEL